MIKRVQWSLAALFGLLDNEILNLFVIWRYDICDLSYLILFIPDSGYKKSACSSQNTRF